ncbi:unnamed protein product [Clonostachys rhizophaga]|uniref:Uncharacterized protein n=1 Tax=Clonostachys rhizophaga TaxID=160324 RepID=A0A9N9W2Z7_9HYPO|nr:unnamed protein product [Clonostachys rhizophaga]
MLFKTVILGLLASVGQALSINNDAASLQRRASSADRLVFCHFMMGIIGDRTSAADYDDDMRRAKDAGIDAFALNIGTDSNVDQQLGYAYQSAANNGMKVFISFDFNWFKPGSDAATVGRMIAQYGSQPGQLIVDNRIFASTFAGDGLDVNAVKSAAGSDVFFVPNFHPEQSSAGSVDGAFNWMGWASDGYNKAPKAGQSVSVADGDNKYLNWLGGKPYMAPVSPWFFTHYGPEVSYSKNWVFPGGSLIFDRWNEVLQKGFPMIEIVTWNDYGESHYIGPLSSLHYDDGNSKWTNDMPHNGWLDLSKPYIAAYKNKDTSVNKYITKDQIIYWYRRTLKSLDCDATDTTSNRPVEGNENYFMGRPDGWNTMDDAVYVVTMLTQAGQLTVTSGGQTVVKEVPAGANLIEVPAAIGQQKFSLSRNGQVVLEDTSKMDISNVCPCGLYNFNAYVGTVPAGFDDPLGPDGLNSLTNGLIVTTCSPQPSLGTNPPTQTGGSGGNGGSTTAAPAPTSNPGTGQCNGGTNADGETENYKGLCSFTCAYGYCPSGPCKCTSSGTPGTPPAYSGRDGCPASGLSDAYKGLCSYTCSHGYCPEGACQYC